MGLSIFQLLEILIFCIASIGYKIITAPVKSHGFQDISVSGFFFMKSVIITSYISTIPKEYVTLDLRLQPYSYDHVRVLISPKYELSGNQREVEDLNRKCWDYNGTYVWLKRMYCGGHASYCCENLSFIRLDTTGHSWIRRPFNGTVVDGYAHILAVTHGHTIVFGHFISDVLIPLLMFPQEIVERSKLVFVPSAQQHLSYLNFIGINPEKAIILDRGQWVYAENLYTPVDPLVHVSHYGQLSNAFARKLREYLKLNEIIPNKYFVTNRNPRQSRHISNMNEIYESIQERYPERNFSILNDMYNFTEASYVWSSAKLVFGPTGSNLFKHYAMANKSVLVIIGSSFGVDTALAIGGGSHDVFTIFGIKRSIPHFKPQYNYFNITPAMRLIEIGLYCSDHSHFNPKDNYTI